MKAAYLINEGPADVAFELRESSIPDPRTNQVLIKVEAFGLNFADVMARLGLYRDAPPKPCVLGYDVVGRIESCGSDVTNLKPGMRVCALTRFGGYAEYAIAEQDVVYEIPDGFSPGLSVALATQYSTARFLSNNMANLQAGDKVLIHAAAGGVGTALTQMALHNKCEVFGTCSTVDKIEYLKGNGVHHPINYSENDFGSVIREINGDHGLDVIFDPMGGKSLKTGFKLLGAGGRLISYGVSSMNKTKSVFGKVRVLLQFGFYHPVQFLIHSRGMIGVNVLKVSERDPRKTANCMQSVIDMTKQGILNPYVGGEFPIERLAEAHALLESRKSMGKIVVKW